jgi:hypothetical protein
MGSRVGNLARAATVGLALLSGCALFSTGNSPLANGPGRDVLPKASRPGADEAQVLPADWSIREPAQVDTAVKQVHYPEGAHDPGSTPPRGPGDAAVEDTGEGKKPGPEGAEPGSLPEFQLAARTEPPLVQALRCYLEHKPAEAPELLKNYDDTSREMLQCLLSLAARLTEAPADQARPEDAAAWVEQLHGLEGTLQRRTPLRIEKMCFCRSIKQFGGFEPLPENPPVFQAGTGGRPGELIQVYAEVRNFVSRQEGPLHITRLRSWAEFCDYDGKQVGPVLNFEDKPDLSRSPRLDYFINYRFGVPPELRPGSYILRIYVQDLDDPAKRLPAVRSLDFRVAAGGSGHGSPGEPSVAAK